MIVTEKINRRTVDIDMQNGEGIARLINNEDKKIAKAIAKILPDIGRAIDEIAFRLQKGGRMAYFGSGTSGRLGILDASEMPPTFGVTAEMIQAYISGGETAIRHEVENAEDSEAFALDDIQNFNPTDKDVVVAVSASGSPLYARKVLEKARKRGVLTIAISSNPEAKIKEHADIFLNPVVGPEVLIGSSRMKSGTAQKMILNMLSTGAMIRLGKTYHNYMIDVKLLNNKLRDRGLRFVREITGADETTAQKVLDESQNVKVACVMIKHHCNKEKAEHLLQQKGGILRRVI